MEGFLEDVSTGKSGELRIGCPETPLKKLMPLIGTFKETYPGIRIIIDQASNAEMVKSIEDHRNELAVIRYKPNHSRLKVKVIWKEEVILIASPDSNYVPASEISVTQLSQIPLILRREGSAVREVVLEYLKKFKVIPLVAMESASLSLQKEFVQRNNGVSFIERDAVEKELKQGILKQVHVLEGFPTVGFGIGYRNRKDLFSPAPGAAKLTRFLFQRHILNS